VWPPHPRPLSPVSRGRGGGGIVGELRTGVRGCGGDFVARAFQPEHSAAAFVGLRGTG